jgi:hypothetical protein
MVDVDTKKKQLISGHWGIETNFYYGYLFIYVTTEAQKEETRKRN